jgi:uncharacterized membrane protein
MEAIHKKTYNISELKTNMKKKDAKMTIENNIINPIVNEFQNKDIVQMIVGATILAIPVGFTEEVWNLGSNLPWINILSIFILSLIFISVFIYYEYHHTKNQTYHKREFFKRVFSTYIVTLGVASLLLTIIDKAPWAIDWALAIKRAVIVSLPASMSAVIADSIK